MPYLIQITPTAIDDIASAKNYYNDKSENLGEVFFDDVEKNLQAISNTPLYYICTIQKYTRETFK